MATTIYVPRTGGSVLILQIEITGPPPTSNALLSLRSGAAQMEVRTGTAQVITRTGVARLEVRN